MMTSNMIPVAAPEDAELVAETLSGNRDAFGQIVSRYQSLVCSLAYSATGSLSQSEDIAQDTFIAAWKQLRSLNEPAKLRAWLCGIARNLTNNSLRRHGREPSHRAEPLEEVAESPSPEPLPADRAISEEEMEILWRSLERIPEIYRMPLILFYREHQSIETVAANLDLTEDAVKQRLSRGRKLLQEQFIAFVEGALARTAPDRAFTLGVLAALPSMALSAKASTLGATAAKGTMTAKTAGTIGAISSVLGPAMIVFGNYLGYRIGMAEARSDEERRHIKTSFRWMAAITFGFCIAFFAFFRWAGWGHFSALDRFGILSTGFIVIYVLTMFSFFIATSGRRHAYYARILKEEHGGHFPAPSFEYRSRATLFGLPLVHVRLGDRFDFLRKPITAWIAVGNYSVGGLFAFGGVAIAPFSIGGLTIGLVPFGALAFGLAPLGALAVGLWSFGGIAIGLQAYGCCAIAWTAALGDFAFAHGFAHGRVAYAAQINNDLVQQFRDSSLYFRFIHVVNRYWLWMNLLWIAPLFVQWQVIARKNRQAGDGEALR